MKIFDFLMRPSRKIGGTRDWKGYNTGTAGDVIGLTGVTFGAGLTRKGMGIDYSLVPQGDLGMTHWISFGFDY